jgi:hypothetical protein
MSSNTPFPQKREKSFTHTEDHVRIQQRGLQMLVLEIGVMWSQAMERWEPPKQEEARTDFPKSQWGNGACRT